MQIHKLFPADYKLVQVLYWNKVNGADTFGPFNQKIQAYSKYKIYDLTNFYFADINNYIITLNSYGTLITHTRPDMTNIEIADRFNGYYWGKNKYPFTPIDPNNHSQCLQAYEDMANPSRMMLSFQSPLAKEVNRQYQKPKRSGALWHSRYKFEIINIVR